MLPNTPKPHQKTVEEELSERIANLYLSSLTGTQIYQVITACFVEMKRRAQKRTVKRKPVPGQQEFLP
jgi:hypothetical protein